MIAALGDDEQTEGFVFANDLARSTLLKAMRKAMRMVCQQLGFAELVRPRDLRRTHGTTITGRGWGRDATDRILAHRDGRVRDIYDRHDYSKEDKEIMKDVADHIIRLATGQPEAANVVRLHQ